MTFLVGMVDVCAVLIAVGPESRFGVDGSEKVYRRNVPETDLAVHAADIFIVVGREVAAGVVVADNGHFSVGANHLDELQHVGLELVVDLLLIGSAVGQGRDSPLGLRLDHAARDVQAVQVFALDDQLLIYWLNGMNVDELRIYSICCFLFSAPFL